MGCGSSSSAAADRNRRRAPENVTLGYWNTRGGFRGNGTRYLLAYAKVPFTETTFDLQEQDVWKRIKEQRSNTDFPGINLPYIEDG